MKGLALQGKLRRSYDSVSKVSEIRAILLSKNSIKEEFMILAI